MPSFETIYSNTSLWFEQNDFYSQLGSGVFHRLWFKLCSKVLFFFLFFSLQMVKKTRRPRRRKKLKKKRQKKWKKYQRNPKKSRIKLLLLPLKSSRPRFPLPQSHPKNLQSPSHPLHLLAPSPRGDQFQNQCQSHPAPRNAHLAHVHRPRQAPRARPGDVKEAQLQNPPSCTWHILHATSPRITCSRYLACTVTWSQ